jgi:hypothetical protein
MAASLVVAGRRAHRTPRLVLASQPFDLGGDDAFAVAVDELGRHLGGGAITVLTGNLVDAELARVVRLGGQFGFVAILRVGATTGAVPAGFARPRHGVVLADVPAGADATAVWTDLVHRARTRPDPAPAAR